MVPVNAVKPLSAFSIIGCWFFIPSLNSLNFAIASLIALFMSFFAVNLISATLLMVTLIAACLSGVILLVEFLSLCYFIYFIIFIKKDRNKRDVFFHALGEASFISCFLSSLISCVGFFWWGATDETGLAWLLMFLVLFIPFILFSIFFYIGRSEIFKMEQAQKDQDSESIER